MMMGSSGYNYAILQNIAIFVLGALLHIFEGELKNGVASGYHSEVIPNTPGQVVPGTIILRNPYGVYRAKVTVFGVLKAGNNGYSAFFPKSMSPQEVVDA